MRSVYGLNVRYLRIPLKKPSSIPPLGGKLAVFPENGWKGCFGGSLGRHPERYAASICGSNLIGLKRASRLRFWAVAARRESSLTARFGPLKRSARQTKDSLEVSE